MVSAIQRRDKLYKNFKHSGLETDKDNYKVAKMHLQKMILKKKKSYFEEELGKNRNKPKELWKILKSLGLSSDKARQSKISLNKDGAIQFEALENANTFKSFYSELAGGLQEKLPRAPNKFTSQTTKSYYAKTSCNVSNDFEFSNVSEEDVKKILLSLDTSKAAGIDQIPAKFLRDGAEVLALPFGNIINLSMKLSIFPEECKIAKLKPIFKKCTRTDPNNYRPIFLLPLISKIIEKSVHFQNEDFLNKKKLIYMYQSGCRTNHSTDLYLAQLIDFVATGMDKQMHTGLILVDLQKAFDTLNHGVPLEKMKYFGFRAPLIKWFESYLSNRKLLVCIDNVFPEAGTLKYGVPQGSILGPLLFLLYVNDLPQSLSDAGSYLYADDTYIFYQHEDVKKIENVLNKEFSSLWQWFIDNKLSIHFGEDKTKSILFSKTRGLKGINIPFAGHSIKQHETVKYVGCQLDSKLSEEAMVPKVLKK